MTWLMTAITYDQRFGLNCGCKLSTGRGLPVFNSPKFYNILGHKAHLIITWNILSQDFSDYKGKF